jgi:sec-independent protein translocase protein TatA
MILLLVFGAKRLPEMGRSLGSGLRGFKEAISDDGPHAAELAPMQTAHVDTTAPAVAAPVAVATPVEVKHDETVAS